MEVFQTSRMLYCCVGSLPNIFFNKGVALSRESKGYPHLRAMPISFFIMFYIYFSLQYYHFFLYFSWQQIFVQVASVASVVMLVIVM